MNLVLAVYVLRYLYPRNFDDAIEKVVLFYYPFDRLSTNAFTTFETASLFSDSLFGTVDCFANRDFCRQLEIFTFPRVVAYHHGHNFSYSGLMYEHTLKAFVASVYSSTFTSAPISGNYFLLRSNTSQAVEEQLFSEFKLLTRFRLLQTDVRELTAFVDGVAIQYEGNFSRDSVRRFVFQYYYHFPVLNGSNYKFLRYYPLAVFVNSIFAGNPATYRFSNHDFIYVRLNSARYAEFAAENGCDGTPCALIIDYTADKRYSSKVADFDAFLEFTTQVSSGAVEPYYMQLNGSGSVGLAYRLRSAAERLRALTSGIYFWKTLKAAVGCVSVVGLAVAMAMILSGKWKFSHQETFTNMSTDYIEELTQIAKPAKVVRKQGSASNLYTKLADGSNAFVEPMLDRGTSSLSAIATSHPVSASENSSLEISNGHTSLVKHHLVLQQYAYEANSVRSESEKADVAVDSGS